MLTKECDLQLEGKEQNMREMVILIRSLSSGIIVLDIHIMTSMLSKFNARFPNGLSEELSRPHATPVESEEKNRPFTVCFKTPSLESDSQDFYYWYSA